jgi:hypothetical protein
VENSKIYEKYNLNFRGTFRDFLLGKFVKIRLNLKSLFPGIFVKLTKNTIRNFRDVFRILFVRRTRRYDPVIYKTP